MPVVPKTKVCRRCKTEKPARDFHRRTRAHDGLQSHCKLCTSSTSRLAYRRRTGQKPRPDDPSPGPLPATLDEYKARCRADDERTERAFDELRAATEAARAGSA